ncbi:MAG TPA: aldo/keto reductase [Treponema sp.]|nr:aldo/keto reductase [Treponema sp.]
MEYVRLGKTDLLVSRTAFGAMCLKDAESAESAGSLIRKAYDAGINFFDTARNEPDSETLLGDSLHDIRQNVLVATKTSASSPQEIRRDLDESLNAMHCDYIDLYQYEITGFIPEKNGRDGIYAALQDLKTAGKIKHIGVAAEDYETAGKVIRSGMYEALQFPFSMISPTATSSLVDLCAKFDMGFIAMQPLCGGVLSNIPLAFGFLYQYENVVPVWGARTIEELNQILYFNDHPPVIDDAFKQDVEKARAFFN